jgi:hypothetical protein
VHAVRCSKEPARESFRSPINPTPRRSSRCLAYRPLRQWWLLRTHFRFVGTNAQGYDEYEHRESGIVFVKLPGGRAVLGSTPEQIELVASELTKEALAKADVGFRPVFSLD